MPSGDRQSALLQFWAEQMIAIGHLPPRLVAPKRIHAHNLGWHELVWIVAQNIALDVAGREMDKGFDRLHPAGSAYNLPVEQDLVWIKETQSPFEIAIADGLEDPGKHLIGITVHYPRLRTAQADAMAATLPASAST